MWFQALSLWKADASTPRSGSASQGKTVRPMLEELERREVLSTSPLGQVATGVVPISFSYVANAGNSLLALGQVGINPISGGVPLTLSATPVAGDPSAQILTLHLGPINLNLLGLQVQTSEICLNITAMQGSGNLLGNLLYDVAHALDTHPGNLAGALNSLSPIEQLLLPYELTTVLNAEMSQVTAVSNLQNADPTTNILHLSLGPLNLDLLGLDVMLNNCAGGPVTVDVNAVQGPGDLLGNLLGGLANALNPSGSANPLFANLVGDVFQLV